VVKVQLSSWQRILYNSISSNGAGDLATSSNKITTKAVMNLMMQLRKTCNHPYLFFNNIDDIIEHDYIFRSSGKF
jgi:ATP-dependent helicase STH1/SNF2